jgi:hypothetical protein
VPTPPVRLAILAAAALVFAPGARADVVWYEVTNGDLSNDPAHPTPITLHVGTSSVIAAVNGTSDYQDWMAITIPAGFQLSAMICADYDSQDPVAFTGVQAGPSFEGDPFDATSYLGYTHFGVDTLGADLLPIMGDPVHAPGSQGFTPPLPSGVYTFLAQQLGEDCLYQFDFEVTPVPAPAGLWVVGLSAIALSRRTRRYPTASRI